MFLTDTSVRIAEVTDGLSNTAMVGESPRIHLSSVFGPYWGPETHTSMSLDEFMKEINPPRAVWLTVPDAAVDDQTPGLGQGDAVIDGGNPCDRGIRRRMTGF